MTGCRRWVAAMSVAAGVFLVGACGGGAGDKASPGTKSETPTSGGATRTAPVPDACTVVTGAQIRAALGMDPGTGGRQLHSVSVSRCFYPSIGLVLIVDSGQNFDGIVAAFEQQGATFETQDGIGDEAKVAVVASGGEVKLVARKATLVADLRVPLIGSVDATKAALVRLAESIFEAKV